MSYDNLRRRLNAEMRLTYETYLLAEDKEEVRRKKDEELYREARTRHLESEKQIQQEKLAKENELFERAERMIAEQTALLAQEAVSTITSTKAEADVLDAHCLDHLRNRLPLTTLKYEMAELHLMCKNMREEIEMLKTQVAELRAEKSCALAHKFSS